MAGNVADEILTRAARSDLCDESFRWVLAALTSDEAMDELRREHGLPKVELAPYFIAPDADGEPCLWRRSDCKPLLTRREKPELWDIAVAGRFPVEDEEDV